jgi:UDP-N-acetylglucosamine 2-epimerase (non-hydrolysing)
MRSVTERPEALEAGTVRLVGTDTDKIVSNVEEVMLNTSIYEAMSRAHNPYGDGRAVARIIDTITGVCTS